MAGSGLVSVTIRPMAPADEPAVRRLYHRCHSAAGPVADGFWHVHPTLVLEDEGQIIGSTSFTMAPHPKKGYVAYGIDVCVDPDHRGQGHGTRLHEARCELARAHGAVDFVGTVEPDNRAMSAILVTAGCRFMSSADGRDFYVGRL